MKTLVLGLGNPILCDDGVGPRVVKELEGRLGEDVTVMEAGLGGLELLDLLAGYDRAIIIDAIQTKGGEPGQIYRLGLEVFQSTRHASSVHDTNLFTALELGRRLGLALPSEIEILAIEVAVTDRFSEECSPEVERGIPACVKMVLDLLTGSDAPGPDSAAFD